jgi:hypothetical protein
MFSMEIPSQFVVRYASSCHIGQQAGKRLGTFNQQITHRRQYAVFQGAYYVEAILASQENRAPQTIQQEV